MKKFTVVAVAVLMVFSVAGAASALTITDTTLFYEDGTNDPGDLNSFGGDFVNKLEYGPGLFPQPHLGDWVSWTHHFEFDPPADEILSATLTISLRDDELPGPIRDGFEFAFGWGEDGIWDFGEVNTADYSYGVSASVLADGTFTVTLASVGGDFYIDESVLEINYTAVPEPGTVLLLGSGVLGLIALKRKRRS